MVHHQTRILDNDPIYFSPPLQNYATKAAMLKITPIKDVNADTELLAN
jgi:hypothetical protein